ncbi:MAG: sce7725 family protein [Chitinophagaceae bacterium]|nr:sce7725 family protein [Chitinophagaceae bacterium]
MYFPYLRGKQFELEALLDVSPKVYLNTLPIIEPVNTTQRKFYRKLAGKGYPLILVTNPYHPQANRLTTAVVQGILDDELSTNPTVRVGYLIDQRFRLAHFTSFLNSNPSRGKAVIFRVNPLPADLTAIAAAITKHPVEYMIFDERLTNSATRAVFNSHAQKVLITDGFQHHDRNADYPPVSTFSSNYNSWRIDGWYGIGDYLSIGDVFKEGGGQVYVVSLHITIESPSGLLMHHFSSRVHSTIKGFSAEKFAEANSLLVASPQVRPLSSSGIELFRDWHHRSHNPQLGAAKKASVMNHIELLSSLI